MRLVELWRRIGQWTKGQPRLPNDYEKPCGLPTRHQFHVDAHFERCRGLVATVSWTEQFRRFGVRETAGGICPWHQPALENSRAARRFIALHLARPDFFDGV